MGSYSEGDCREWVPPDRLLMMLSLLMFLIILMFGLMVVLFEMGFLVLGLVGVVFTLPGLVLGGLVVGGVALSCCLLVILVLNVVFCLILFVVLFSLFSVLSFWGVILALQCSSAVHLGVDNPNVVRHVSRFLEGRVSGKPLELTFDGDLLIIIERMIQLRGAQNLKITKV